MNPDNEQFQTAKQNILDDFQDKAFSIFDDFGELDLKQIQQDINARLLADHQKNQEEQGHKKDDFNSYVMPMREKEKIQYITFESIKRNFYKVFNKPHDAMAEILFRYASDCSMDNIDTARVNYHQFLNKFTVLWPQKVEQKEGRNKTLNDQEAYFQKLKEAETLNRLVFRLFDRDNDGILSILDLNWLASKFTPKCKMGVGISEMISLYMDKNVRPKYVKEKTIIDY